MTPPADSARGQTPPAALSDDAVNGLGPTLWDNSALAESFSGVTTPLTFSFAAHAYQQIFRQFCQVMGVPADYLGRRIAMFDGMLGLVRGRLYCNVVNWHRIAHLLPWFTTSPAQSLDLLGARSMRDIVESSELGPEARATLSRLFDVAYKTPRYSMWDRVRLGAAGIWRFVHLRRIVGDFQHHFDTVFSWAKNLEFRKRSLPEQLAAYRYLDKQLLRQWSAPIINDAFYFAFFALLKRLTMRWLKRDANAAVILQNDLLCGQGDLQILEPTKMLMRIAAATDAESPETRAWLLRTSAVDIVAALTAPPAHAEAFVKRVKQFIALYGFRCADELKLEAQDLHTNPTFAIQAIVRFIRTKQYDTSRFAARERQTHHQALAQVSSALTGLRRIIYLRVLRYLSQTLSHREQLRFLRTQVVGVIRHLFLAMGENLAALKAIETTRDIFYLTCEEVFAYIEGRALTTDLRPIVDARRTAFAAFAQTPAPPRRFVTYGSGSASMTWPHILEAGSLDEAPCEPSASQDAKDVPKMLVGTPCSAGLVEGRVCVARDLSDAEALVGDILVTHRTDPAWVLLYPTYKGLLIAQGSLLSHTSAAARELGLPTIVGLGSALTRRLKTGMRVRMDGQTGQVEILAEDSAQIPDAAAHRAAS